jgi:hypothetical protein
MLGFLRQPNLRLLVVTCESLCIGTLCLNSSHDIRSRHIVEQVPAFQCVVTLSRPELIEETNGVYDTKFLDEGMGCAMG